MQDSFMKIIGLSFAAVAGSLVFVTSASAIPGCGFPVQCAAPGAGGEESSTQAFLGMRWDFGAAGPALTGGVRVLKSNGEDGVYGVQADGSLPLTGDSHLPKLRVLGLFGTKDVQAQVGGGYDFAIDSAIISGGLQGPYVEGGLDYGLDGSLAPYIGVNSLKAPELGGGAACPADYTLVAVDGNEATYQTHTVYVDDQYISGGQACIGGEFPPP